MVAAALLAASSLMSGCGEGSDAGDSLACVEIDMSCAPLYQPTFDEVFSRTLQPTCSAGGSSCHAAAGARGGLVLDEADEAYAGLLGEDGSSPRIDLADPGCSLVLRRLNATGSSLMPPGAPLTAAERCSIALWIAGGAER